MKFSFMPISVRTDTSSTNPGGEKKIVSLVQAWSGSSFNAGINQRSATFIAGISSFVVIEYVCSTVAFIAAPISLSAA